MRLRVRGSIPAVAFAFAVAVALAGCGGAGQRAASGGGGSGVTVIRAWSQALARGDIGAAGAYFATPSRVQLDPAQPLGTVRSAAEARSLNLQLPCGAKLLDARPVGRYIDALFLLTSRPGAACNGLGGTARVAFVIRAGKIAVWRRIADEPGDGARGAPGAQPPASPSPSPSPSPLPPAARSV